MAITTAIKKQKRGAAAARFSWYLVYIARETSFSCKRRAVQAWAEDAG